MIQTISLTDKNMVKSRFYRSIATYNRSAVVQKNIAQELIREVASIEAPRFDKVLEIGCGTGFLTDALLKRFQPQQYILNDLVGLMQNEIAQIASKHDFSRWSFIEGDAEKIPLPGHLDLVVSSSTIQWFQHPAAFFNTISQSLQRNGILALSTFGEENFREIKTLSKVGLHYPSLLELNMWLTPFFKDIQIKEDIVPLHFVSPREILLHIKQTGVNGIERKNWNKTDLFRFESNYRETFSMPGNTLSLTYHPIIIIAKKR
jgi:malonyl-CoA O-methyltransferase